jgi:hypothetical protein
MASLSADDCEVVTIACDSRSETNNSETVSFRSIFCGFPLIFREFKIKAGNL